MRFIYTLFALLAFSAQAVLGADLITTNVLQRIRQIRYGGQSGTAFSLEVDGRQYLVTARHLFTPSGSVSRIEVRNEPDWLPIAVRRLEVLPEDVDIAVFAPAEQVTPVLPIAVTATGLALSQDLFFLGYPYGMSTAGQAINAGFPLPFVKKGVCAALMFQSGYLTIYIDALNNPGFSGGPVVAMHAGSTVPTIVGVVSGYRFEDTPVLRKGAGTDLSLRSNTGLAIATSIQPALDAIAKNPVGFRLAP